MVKSGKKPLMKTILPKVCCLAERMRVKGNLCGVKLDSGRTHSKSQALQGRWPTYSHHALHEIIRFL